MLFILKRGINIITVLLELKSYNQSLIRMDEHEGNKTHIWCFSYYPHADYWTRCGSLRTTSKK
jgi:hypothetical protein